MNSGTPLPCRPTSPAYTGNRPQNAPIASPDRPAATVATGAIAYNRPSVSRVTTGTSGGRRRVAVTGSTAAHTRIAVSMNIASALASPSINSTWPSASAERLITMYSENARLRRAGSGSALSQLSITVYSPTSAMPVAMRSRPQPTGLIHSGCSSTAIAASAAKKANARICPIRPISEGATKVPAKNPAK
ncbi:hypothetical protein D3C72_1388770 [compost metagenome]